MHLNLTFKIIGGGILAALIIWWAVPVTPKAHASPPSKSAGVSPVRFSEHLISKGYSYGYGIGAADINKDGHMDLTSADALGHNSLYWFENDGHDNFRRHYILKAEPYRKLERHKLADM